MKRNDFIEGALTLTWVMLPLVIGMLLSSIIYFFKGSNFDFQEMKEVGCLLAILFCPLYTYSEIFHMWAFNVCERLVSKTKTKNYDEYKLA